VRELWEEEYKGKYGPVPLMSAHNPLQPKNPDDRFGGPHRHKRLGPQPRVVSTDRYLAFITTDREDQQVDALEFWNARHKSQPVIARFALDMLAIPMMSAECFWIKMDGGPTLIHLHICMLTALYHTCTYYATTYDDLMTE
jgi:hAT family protein